MFQVALAYTEAEQLLSMVPDQQAPPAERTHRRICAALHSVMRFLEQQADVSSTVVGAERYMSPRYDPLPMLDRALAFIPESAGWEAAHV
jgi:hypothetical protein